MGKVIGLTGGIAMGKSTVSTYLADRYGIPILDADTYAREAVQPGTAIWQQIVERYSPEIVRADGSLDRQQLGRIVFADPQERRWLEQQIHPYVRQRLIEGRDRLLQYHPERPVVLVIPLLFEARMMDLVSEIWVVCCPLQRQLEHLIQRDGLSQPMAMARIESQLPIQVKCEQAQIVLDNTSTLDHLLGQVDQAIGQSESVRPKV
jgi:dephospho-CoA kinase